MTTAITLFSSFVTTIATVILALLTRRYVLLTQQMVQSMEAVHEPFVDIELDLPSMELRLAFVNAGGTAARNIQFHVDEDCNLIRGYGSHETGIGSMHPIRNGISYLPAGQRLIYSAGHCPSDISNSPNSRLQVTITYQNDGGRTFSRTVSYDLGQIDHLLFETFNNSHAAIAKAIRDAEERSASRQSGSRSMQYLRQTRGTTLCPYCRERIPSAAKKCRHCSEWITSASKEPDGSSDGVD